MPPGGGHDAESNGQLPLPLHLPTIDDSPAPGRLEYALRACSLWGHGACRAYVRRRRGYGMEAPASLRTRSPGTALCRQVKPHTALRDEVLINFGGSLSRESMR